MVELNVMENCTSHEVKGNDSLIYNRASNNQIVLLDFKGQSHQKL